MLVHRLRVQNPWLKVLQQEQVVVVQEQPVLLQEQPASPGSAANPLSAPTDSTPRLGVGRKRAVQRP